MRLPAPIQTFFDADRTPVGTAPMGAFTCGAVVKDEGKTHVGRDAIEVWWSTAKAHYEHTAVPCEVKKKHRLTIVHARVTGRFPGSPALLKFAFQLADGRIEALEISA